jgi:hypothetical protein
MLDLIPVVVYEKKGSFRQEVYEVKRYQGVERQ